MKQVWQSSWRAMRGGRRPRPRTRWWGRPSRRCCSRCNAALDDLDHAVASFTVCCVAAHLHFVEPAADQALPLGGVAGGMLGAPVHAARFGAGQALRYIQREVASIAAASRARTAVAMPAAGAASRSAARAHPAFAASPAAASPSAEPVALVGEHFRLHGAHHGFLGPMGVAARAQRHPPARSAARALRRPAIAPEVGRARRRPRSRTTGPRPRCGCRRR
jgi:hypothetical protein